MFVIPHDFCNFRAGRFHPFCQSFDFGIVFCNLILQRQVLPKVPFLFPGELDRRQSWLARTVDTGKGIQCQFGGNSGHRRRLIMLQTPDPLVQALENHILLGLIPDDIRCGQIVIGVVSPDSAKCADIDVCDSQVKTQLKLVVQKG